MHYIVMKKTLCTTVLGLVFLFAPMFTYAQTFELYTLSGFLKILFEKDLIAEDKMEHARELVVMLEGRDTYIHNTSSQKITVQASQYIEHANLTFTTLQDVQGLVLVVKNTGNQKKQLYANKTCPITYDIYDEENKQVFTSTSLARCSSNKEVRYTLDAGENRLYEVGHKQKDFQLHKGVYRFVLSYPNYGSGEREVTIQ